MAGVLQHLRSSTLDKRPNPASMVDGQVAINYASGAPGMFFKDSNGDLVKVGPVHVGSSAPNVSPASGGTAGNSIGEQWLDNSGGTYVFKIWDGSAWRSEAGEFVNTTGDTMTGALGVITGTASAPGVFFSGDTNTGIYSPGADQVAVATNGTGRLFVDASGSISTSSTAWQGTPVFQLGGLQIGASTYAKALLQTGGTNRAEWFFDSADNYLQANSGSFSIFNTTANPIAFGTDGSERLRITSAGLVGIGTSSPSALLHVSSTGAVESLLSGGGTSGDTVLHLKGNGNAYKFIVPNSAAQYGMGLYDVGNAAYRLYVNSAGNVGIGSTTLVERLHVNGSVRTDVNDAGLFFNSSTTAITGNGTSSYIAFNTSNAEKARLDSSGRLLVGTSSARGSAGVTGQFQLEGTTYNNSSVNLINNGNDSQPPYLVFGKSRSNSVGGNTIIQSGDYLGRIDFAGADGTDLASTGAWIGAIVDGTPGANDLPTRLVFSTTADGASSPTASLTIFNAGKIGTGTRTESPYNFTTAIAANMHVDGSGFLYRSTSSAKYKTNIETLQDIYADAILSVRPVWYQSTTGNDNPSWGWWGFIAEEVAEIDPRLVFWRTKETVTDEDGTTSEVDLEQPVAEGVQYDRFVPHLLNLIKRQQQAIETLEAKVAALESA